jgi:hypothetical protein
MLRPLSRNPIFSAYLRLALSLFVILSFTGCNPISFFLQPSPTATNTPVPSPTLTATSTLTPTATTRPTSTPRPATETPTPNPTATERAKLRSTLEAALARVSPEMDKVGLNASDGHIEWLNPDPYTLKVSSYGESQVTRFGEKILKDFVLHTEITWNSTSGLAGCGVIFHADDDFQNGGQYDFVLMRLQFQPRWDIEYWKFGRWQTTLTGSLLPSNVINDEPLSTNKVTLVVKGDEFIPYVNGEKLQVVTSDKQPEGYLAFHAWQESGESSCQFSNSWLWAPGPGDYSPPPAEG